MKFSARFFISAVLIFVGYLFVYSQKTFAASQPPLKPWENFAPSLERVENEEFNARENETQNPKNANIFHSRQVYMGEGDAAVGLIHMIAGQLTEKNRNSAYFNDYEKRGAIGTLAQAIGTMYANPAASGFAWVQDTLANAGLLAKPSYAQGIGFVGLAPLLPLWKTARNISYAILIIIMVVVGFMIIFRAKIDPKTVISVQAALPRIIFTLILITLSYPIAGFMIDLMYLTMAILINLLASGLQGIPLPAGTDFMKDAVKQQSEFITGGWGKLFVSVFSLNMFWPFILQMFGGSISNIVGYSIATGIGTAIGAVIGGAGLIFSWPVVIGALGPALIILLILFLGLLFTFIRITFLLLNSYIQVLIAVILGPLLLLKEAIPGQSAFKEWILNLIANLVVFPATAAIIYGSWIFTAVAWKSNLWGAPLIPVGGGGDLSSGNPLAIFLGLGVIFLAPNLVASVKKAFHPKPTLPVTAGTAFSPLTGGIQTGMGAMSQFYYMKQVFGGGEPGSDRGSAAGLLGGIRNALGIKR